VIVVDWKPIKHDVIGDVTVRRCFFNYSCPIDLAAPQRDIFNAGSAEDFMIVTSATGEPIISSMELDSADPIVPPIRPRSGGITAYQLWQVQKLRRDIRKEYLDHWEATATDTGTGRPVDAIICPAAPYTAYPHGKGRLVPFYLSSPGPSPGTNCRYSNYTTVWNGLDYPASIFPVTTVDPTLDAKNPLRKFYDDVDKTIYEMCE
jgi:hypothetical protein